MGLLYIYRYGIGGDSKIWRTIYFSSVLYSVDWMAFYDIFDRLLEGFTTGGTTFQL